MKDIDKVIKMYCQLKYVKHQYLTLFKTHTKIEMSLSIISSILICYAIFNIFSDKTIAYIMFVCGLIPFIIFYVKGIKHCRK